MQTRFSPTNRPETMGANVLFQIRELLLTGQLMPGEMLSLRSIAQAAGVSVMPVREAVAKLVAEQALEVTPNRSVRVPILTVEQFTEVTNIRVQIEGYAVEQAALTAPESLIPVLRDLNKRFIEAMDAPSINTTAVVMLNKEMHFQIYEAAAMPMLLKIIDGLWLRIGPILNYDIHVGSQRTDKKTAVVHHTNLIDALERRDPTAAKMALKDDIESAYRHILEKKYA
ncbi:MAG TPA: GntR family transcriptional regulator [Candidimonas sp.]|nr:GntR family transcriptional regulator [Candidimonas sp.]